MAKKIKRVALAAAAALAIGMAALAWNLNKNIGDMYIPIPSDSGNRSDSPPSNGKPDTAKPPAADAANPKPKDFYALIVGLDTRPGSHTMNTDTLILLHVLPQNKSVKMVSLPRDLRMENEDGAVRKINALFYEGYLLSSQRTRQNPDLLSGKKTNIGGLKFPEEHIGGGLAHLRDEIEDWMGIDIRHTVLVHFESLVSLVDAVGGIEIEVKRSMYYDDPTDGTHISFEPGLQRMDGAKALNYARFRHDNRGPRYDSNDFERSERQQQIIAALADKLVSWSSVTRLTEIADIMSDSVKTDMTRTDIVSYIQNFYNTFSGNSIVSVPFKGYWESPYVKISEEEFRNLKQTFTEPAASVPAQSASGTGESGSREL